MCTCGRHNVLDFMGVHHCIISPCFFTLLVCEYQGQRWRLGRWFQKCLLSACVTESTVPWRLVVLQCLEHPIISPLVLVSFARNLLLLNFVSDCFLPTYVFNLNMLQPRQSIQKTGTLSPLFFVSLGEYCQMMYHVTPNSPILRIV